MGGAADGEALWRLRVDKVLKGAPFETLNSRDPDGIEIRPLYPAASAPAHALRRRPDRPWRISQRVDHPDAAAANEQALADLAGGADALRLVFAGSPFARGFGIEAQALAAVLSGVELDLVSIGLDPAPAEAMSAARALAGVVSAGRLVPDALDVDFGIDPIGATAATGRRTSLDETAPLVRSLADDGLRGPMLRADARLHHEAGASAAEELAAALATGVAYWRLLEGAGFSIEDARGLLSFQMAADADQFTTLAKFRALRRLWASVERACGLDPEPVRLSAETSFRMATRRDPAVNWLRTTTALFAAAAGGADEIAVLPHASALGLPDAFSRRMARNQQIILQGESHLGHVGDPAAGSGAVEALTDELCRRGWAIFGEIEAGGGMEAALADGAWQARLARSLDRRRAELAAGRSMLVGSTAFRDDRERETAVLIPARAAAAPVAPDFAPLRSVRDEELAQAGGEGA